MAIPYVPPPIEYMSSDEYDNHVCDECGLDVDLSNGFYTSKIHDIDLCLECYPKVEFTLRDDSSYRWCDICQQGNRAMYGYNDLSLFTSRLDTVLIFILGTRVTTGSQTQRLIQLSTTEE